MFFFKTDQITFLNVKAHNVKNVCQSTSEASCSFQSEDFYGEVLARNPIRYYFSIRFAIQLLVTLFPIASTM